MLLRTASIVLALAISAAVPTVAGAKTRHTHRYTATIRLAAVSVTGTVPAAGSSELQAGLVQSNLGRGSALATFNFDGTPTATGTAELFYPRGYIKSTATSSATPQPDGSLAITGGGKVLKGTGRFKGATGSYTCNGVEAAGSAITTLSCKGTLKY